MSPSDTEVGGEFFQTETRMAFGAYFCHKNDDRTYAARLYGCDAITDNQANLPEQTYASRHEIRSTLAFILETVSQVQEATPRNEKEAELIRVTRQQLLDLLTRLKNEEDELPALLPNEKVQTLLEETFATACEVSAGIEKEAQSDNVGNRPSSSEELLRDETGRVDLDPSALQQLKLDLQQTLADFQNNLHVLSNDPDGQLIRDLFPPLSSGYNSIILYASILEKNGLKVPGLREYVDGLFDLMRTLTEQMGGDAFSVRSLRGSPRYLPPNQSSFLDDSGWNELMQQYEEAVHNMGIAEHVGERLMPRFGEEYYYRMLVRAYVTFIRKSKGIQQFTGPLRHYEMLKKVIAPQLHQLAEAVEFPIDELEVM